MKKEFRRLLSVDDLSEWLGVPPWQIRNLVRQRKIPVVRIDARLRFDRESIERWIKQNDIKPLEENKMEKQRMPNLVPNQLERSKELLSDD